MVTLFDSAGASTTVFAPKTREFPWHITRAASKRLLAEIQSKVESLAVGQANQPCNINIGDPDGVCISFLTARDALFDSMKYGHIINIYLLSQLWHVSTD